MVLEEDDHAAIIAAVEKGRRSHGDIRRLVRFTLTSSVAASVLLVLAPLAGLPVPLLLLQVLWIKLVIDSVAGLALIAEPAEPDTMRRPSQRTSGSIVAGGSWQHILWVGLLMGIVTLGVGILAMDRGWHWQTMVFSLLAFLQLGHALAVRSERQSRLRLGWRTSLPLMVAIAVTVALQLATVYVPQLQPVFGTGALASVELAVVLAASPLAFVAVEGVKWLQQQRPAKPVPQEQAAV